MKKNLLFLFLGLLSSFSVCNSNSFINIHLGLNVGINVNVNTYYLRHWGITYAWNEANINATTIKGSGSIRGSYATIWCDNYNFNGSLFGDESCNIKAKTFEARGTITAKKVIINCDEFKFTGSILAQECTIHAKQPFDESMFTRDKDGTYTIIITP